MSRRTADQQLLSDICQHNAEALGELYDRYADKLMGLAYRILGSRRDAEDLLHDIFCEVWKKAAGYDPERGSVMSWLLLRTRSRALDRLRKLQTARKYALLTAQEQPVNNQPAPAGELHADHQRAIHAIHSLPPPQRQVVELKYFSGLSLTEIAERCSTPVGTIKSRLSAALAKLRSELGPGDVRDAQT